MAVLTQEARKWILTSLAKKHISQAKADALFRCNRPAREIGIAVALLNQRSITVGKALKEARQLIGRTSYSRA